MRFAFASTLSGLPWGASEELWSQTARYLLDRGRNVVLLDSRAPEDLPPRLRSLVDRGARTSRLWGGLRASLILVSVSYATDDLRLVRWLRALGLPYALLVHCVSEDDWITSARWVEHCKAYENARSVFFVSENNRRIVERQLARPLGRALIVDNPPAVKPEQPLPWPEGDSSHRLRLACVGRLHCRSKGQDLILDVLRRGRWRGRDVLVTFWGEDQGNRRQLEDLTRRHGLEGKVRFRGHTETPLDIWRRSHGLLLPSRYEGMPMVTAEAMFCGRVPVVTACGRNVDWVEDGTTGFLSPAATADLLDATLERAWRERTTWRDLGLRASARIRRVYDPHPVETFADLLTDLARSRS